MGVAIPLIRLRGLRYRYGGAGADALDGLDLDVEAGEFLVVVGRNGSGKSTLARLLGGLDRPTAAGEAIVAGHDITTPDGRLAARRDVGVLFQNPENQLVGATVEEDVAFGLENLALPQREIRDRVDGMLTAFGLDDLRTRQPHLLSGGQKQRTALAGVLAIPRLALVLDEPTAMLDPAGRRDVLAAVSGQWRDGLTIVYVTQEMDEVALGTRVLAVDAGRAIFSGTPAELFGDTAAVERLGLGLPPAAEVAVALAELGRPLRNVPLSADELVGELSDAQAGDAR